MTPDPVDAMARGMGVELRAFVRDAGRRRALPFTAYVGVPGAVRTPLTEALTEALVGDLPDDPALRADLVERVVDSLAERDLRRACGWVTRPGPMRVDTRELAWFVAVTAGFARHGLVLPAFFIVGRSAWLEVRSGRTREWARVRARPQVAATSSGDAGGPARRGASAIPSSPKGNGSQKLNSR